MEGEPLTVALVLAAGSASRFGEQKLLAPLGGQPLVRWVAENGLASGVDRVVVVVGAEGKAVQKALEDLPVAVVYNPRHREGMSTSIRIGVAALPERVDWVLILLGDQPGVTPELVNRVLEGRSRGGAVVAPVYREGQGNPVLFHASVLPELQALEGDGGARAVVERDPDRVIRVDLDMPMPPDVDTAEDFRRLRAEGVDG